MNYIVDPNLIYWISISDNIRVFAMTFLVISAIFVVFGLLGFCVVADVFNDKDKSKAYGKIWKAFILSITILITSSLIYILVPTKSTLIQMIVAKAATFENVAGVYKFTKHEISEAINYIFKGNNTILTNDITKTNIINITNVSNLKEKTNIDETIKNGSELIKNVNKTINSIEEAIK